jgi:predicted amidohydrolase
VSILSEQCVSLYDTIANILCQLKKISPEHFYQEYSVDGIPKPEGADSAIELRINQLRELAYDSGISLSMLLVRYGLPVKITSWIFQEWSLNRNFKALHTLLNRLTCEIAWDDLQRHAEELPLGFESLNENVERTGFLILPRFDTIIERVMAGDETDLENETANHGKYSWANDRRHLMFNHIYYIEKEKLTTDSGRQFHIENFIMEKIDRRKFGLESLVIAASPVIYADVLDSVPEESGHQVASGVEQQFFRINGLKEDDLIHSRIKAAYFASCREYADVLIFPEMLGDRETFDSCFWNRLQQQAENGGLHTPKLILTPTWWHDFTNELRIYNDGGECILSQQKQYPFDCDIVQNEVESNLTEDLQEPDSIIRILHIPGIGRLLVTICKDFLIESYRDILLRELGATFLVIPSYSLGSTKFELSLLDAMKHGCYVLWLNTCSAFWGKKDPDYIGIVASPFLSEIQHKWFCPMKPKCGMQCGGENEPCLFVITIEPDLHTVTCNHKVYPGA